MNTRYITLAAALIFSSLGPIAQAETLTGWVTQITDGDTITVQDYSNQQHKVWLIGIDAPEKYQAFGNLSHQKLGALLNGRDVAVEWNKRDRYGRIIGKVMAAPFDSPCRNQRDCPKTLDAGLEQIKTGQAWWYRGHAKEQTPEDQSKYERAEFEAKIHRNGLWADSNPVPPWELLRK
ncbi:nuclease [Sulfuricella sp. T08]|uniref:thermonuclease family protein n=1 Tax=Sulfuricella sp. T08 TaxID=1632857 RepID=UPI0006179F27|nr:thermonuclease family protein [Sulfuricella sp. T08]GAO36282.1 nuclease [Sulfuricella sp. T08]